MANKLSPARSWEIDDLCDLAQHGQRYLKAVPVLILAKWVQRGRQEGVANRVQTEELAAHLENSGLAPAFKPKGTSAVGSVLTRMQNNRNLTEPPLIEYEARGRFWVNFPHYELLVQEYRRWYHERYPTDFAMLFPEGEPSWEAPKISGRQPFDIQPESLGIIQVLEQYDRFWHERLDESQIRVGELEDEIENLREEIEQYTQPLGGIADETLRSRLLPLGSSPLDTLIREAGVVLEDRLRTLARAGSTNHGVALVDEVLRPKSGTVVFSSHEGEQEGVRMLFRGAMQFIRNPPMHRLIEYHEDTAHLFIRLIDSLLSLLAEGEIRQNE